MQTSSPTAEKNLRQDTATLTTDRFCPEDTLSDDSPMVKMSHTGVYGFVSHHVKQGWALAKRRPLFFFGIWVVKWLVVLLFISLFRSPTTTQALTGSGGSSDSHQQQKGSEGGSVPILAVPSVRTAPPLSPYATIVTALGNIELQFLPDDAPKTVANFIELARRGFFNGTTLYRYEKNFVLQGGGWPTKTSPLPAVPLEYKVPNYKFHVSTARTSDPNSATCEYSIMLNDNSKWLAPGGSDPHGYAVFARVVDGFDVIEKFASLKTRVSGLTMLDPAVKVHAWVISMRQPLQE